MSGPPGEHWLTDEDRREFWERYERRGMEKSKEEREKRMSQKTGKEHGKEWRS